MDLRWNELHKKEYLWAGEKLSTRNVALKVSKNPYVPFSRGYFCIDCIVLLCLIMIGSV